ncbi:MAG: protein kinase [Proteobacteria bacterium]|nr:protein kinase [Pseudomonadota bacterium]
MHRDGMAPPAIDEYRLVKPIAQGGMGSVYLYHDTALQRHVAIKFITEPDQAKRSRFLLEARAAARLDHPNIMRVYRLGEIDGQPYIASEYLPGESLDRRDRARSWRQVFDLSLPLSSALAAAHRRGVLHRDIKPSNIIVSAAGEPKLTDFGLAKLVDLPDRDADEPAGSDDPRASTPAIAKAAPQTAAGVVVGTPYYIAPEIWQGEAATPRSDVYSFGALLFALCTGEPPHWDVPPGSLGDFVSRHEATPLATRVADVDRRFASIVDTCLRRDPGARFESGGALWNALKELDWSAQSPISVQGNPYRGLLPFEADHRALFFGRDREAREIVERLRTESVVLVAGESGVGKSSLVRAGVVPRIVEGDLGDGRAWQSCILVPGLRPLSALLAVLADHLGGDDDTAQDQLEADVGDLSRLLRRHMGRNSGLVIVVDQLEELVTLSDPDQAAAASQLLAGLAERTPGVRFLATVRGDKATALARMPGLGAILERALYVLRPLDEHAIREIIVRPALAKHVHFESEDLVDALVHATVDAAGGLPVLEFALSQLWQARDAERAVIANAAYRVIGGVEGALSRHADGVLAALLPEIRDAARILLIRLVTSDGTRNRKTEKELLSSDQSRRALQTLVDGRLVVECELDGQSAYEIAHEALIARWEQLRHWLDQEGATRAVREELAEAASRWDRRGRKRDSLWRGATLKAASTLTLAALARVEADFLRASRRAAAWARWFLGGLIAAPVVVAGLLYGVVELRETMVVDQLVDQARPVLERARAKRRAFLSVRDQATAAFRADNHDVGARYWQQSLDLASQLEQHHREATSALQRPLARAPGRDDIRGLWASLLAERARLADVLGQSDRRDWFFAQLQLHGDGPESRDARDNSASVSLRTSPPGLVVELYRYLPQRDGSLESVPLGAETAPTRWKLEPGSYLVVVAATDTTIAMKYPFLIQPIFAPAELEFELRPPAPGHISDRFVYVAPGEFVYGLGRNRSDEAFRKLYTALPEHRRRTGAYWIDRHETTFGDWIEFLDDLAAGHRRAFLPHGSDRDIEIQLVYSDGDYQLHFRVGTDGHRYRFGSEKAFVYVDRDRRQKQNWRDFPVTGISAAEAREYVAWLDRIGRVPGARLCREDEWERAARGADRRTFPHGERLALDDANIDETYGKKDAAFGLDEVGSHPRSQSPFGVQGMVGNASEVTLSIVDHGQPVHRGGAFFFSAHYGSVNNRTDATEQQQSPYVGLRVCADAAAAP